jgi:glyceraldehyde 3-phosphate dehydrogenase
MVIKVGINGFGRIGRNILRGLIETGRKDIEVVAINDLGPVETNAHLLQFDSVHGRLPFEVVVTNAGINVARKQIRVTSEPNPSLLNWPDVDIALECTGFFTDRDKAAMHLKNGSKRVLVSAPSTGADKTIVYGVNHNSLTSTDLVVSNASCTTNCLAPVAKVLHDSFGIKTGYMTTVHSYTGDQPSLDTVHKDLYRGRAASLSMIPTSTGAAKAVSLVLPELEGKLDGSAIRVPTPNVSCIDLKFLTEKEVSVQAINEKIKSAAEGDLRGILGYESRSLVSIDFNHLPASSTFAAQETKVLPSGMARILSWYDNEWGFSNRMADTAVKMGELI